MLFSFRVCTDSNMFRCYCCCCFCCFFPYPLHTYAYSLPTTWTWPTMTKCLCMCLCALTAFSLTSRTNAVHWCICSRTASQNAYLSFGHCVSCFVVRMTENITAVIAAAAEAATTTMAAAAASLLSWNIIDPMPLCTLTYSYPHSDWFQSSFLLFSSLWLFIQPVS